ncbi:MAG: dihydrodipicolinate synthase family protein, partial [Acidobacteria bacterium]|nr:dihydrodipicolinate synthase family protein [Acidobacteriota bacterium]
YSVPVFTAYDMPADLVIELAEHPNIIGIKESGGDVAKVRRMAEGTRHIRRTATVTETFAALTPRMIKTQTVQAEKTGELVPLAALAGKSGSASRESSSLTAPSPGQLPVPAIKMREKEVGFQISVGAAQQLDPSLVAGAVGAILAFACPAPTACYEVYAAWKERDSELARIKQDRIAAAATRVSGELGIPALKYAMDLNGYYGGPSRLPLLPLTADLKSEVERLMRDIRN